MRYSFRYGGGKEVSPHPSRRLDIQGLRAISAFLIMAYHIWIGRVSGGVDVFFVISGFFIGGSLLRTIDRGQFDTLKWWSHILSRVIPSAIVIIFITAALSLYFIPPSNWRPSSSHMVASAMQIENLNLMRVGVEYLGRDQKPSAYQQFWALSLQFQIYGALTGLALLSCVSYGRSRSALIFLFGVTFLLSLVYSLIETPRAPSSAYFNPGARLWEFMAGCLMAAIPNLPKGRWWREILSATGLILIVLTGIILPETTEFPGYASLIPVTGAAIFIAAGSEQDTVVQRFLSNRFLVSLGDLSFSIYLIHWPILVFVLHYFNETVPSVWTGTIIMVSTIALAFILKRTVETPFCDISKRSFQKGLTVSLSLILATTLVGVLGRSYLDPHKILDARSSVIGLELVESDVGPRELDVSVLNLAPGFKDFTTALRSNCVAAEGDPVVTYCLRGSIEGTKSIVLVGGSHTFQWEPAFDTLGREYGIKIYVIGKVSCSLGSVPYYENLIGVENYSSCLTWNKDVIKKIKEINPDLVVTLGTMSNRHGELDDVEVVPDTFISAIGEIAAANIPIVGIRDNPWFNEDPNECLWRHAYDISVCDRSKGEVLLDEDPSITAFANIANFFPLDLNGHICSQESCLGKREGIFIWADSHHITRSFAQAMAHIVFEKLNELPPFRAMLSQN